MRQFNRLTRRRTRRYIKQQEADAAEKINMGNIMLGILKISLVMAAGVIASLSWLSPADARGVRALPPARGIARQPNVQAAITAGEARTSPWTPLNNQPTFLAAGASLPMLLTDGTVLVQDTCAADWWRLKPAQYGSYVNGSWTQVGSM